jgi:predicted esterase
LRIWKDVEWGRGHKCASGLDSAVNGKDTLPVAIGGTTIMPRNLAKILFMLAAMLPAAAQAAEMQQRAITFNNEPRNYVLYVPDTAKTPAPMILLLHGSFGSAARIASLWKADADANGIVLVAPTSRTISGWNLIGDHPDFLRAAILDAATQHPIDPRRMYLFGQSGGAVYALDMAVLESQYFACAAVHAGAWRQPEEFLFLNYAQRRIPMMIVVGSIDQFFSMQSVRQTEAALKKKGFPITVNVMEGYRHDYSERVAPQVNGMAWGMFKDCALDQPPVFAEIR